MDDAVRVKVSQCFEATLTNGGYLALIETKGEEEKK